jgi:hypothetical protein
VSPRTAHCSLSLPANHTIGARKLLIPKSRSPLNGSGPDSHVLQALAAFTVSAATKARAGALLVSAGRSLTPHSRRVAELVARSRLPAMYEYRFYAEYGGGLISYGADAVEMWRRAATFVDKIFKGAKPRRHADRAAQQVRAGDQSQDREGARSNNLPVDLVAGGRDHTVGQDGETAKLHEMPNFTLRPLSVRVSPMGLLSSR